MPGFDCHASIRREHRTMTTDIERLIEKIGLAVLLANALMECYEYEYENRSYCGCCGQSFGFGEDLDEHLVHNSECPVLIAKKILNKDNS